MNLCGRVLYMLGSNKYSTAYCYYVIYLTLLMFYPLVADKVKFVSKIELNNSGTKHIQ